MLLRIILIKLRMEQQKKNMMLIQKRKKEINRLRANYTYLTGLQDELSKLQAGARSDYDKAVASGDTTGSTKAKALEKLYWSI